MLVTFFIIPMFLLAWMSFHSWPLLGSERLIGLENFEELVTDTSFHEALRFTALFTLIVTPVQVIISYVLAVVVRAQLRGAAILRTVYFIPVVIGGAAASYMFVVMLQPGVGLLDRILEALGLTNGLSSALTSPTLAVAVVVLIGTWKSVGTGMILFMAGMQAVPDELFEAAKVDGAGWLRREWSIMLPLVKQMSALVLIMTLAGGILTFDQFWIMTRGGPHGATVTAVMWMYIVGFVRYRLGYSAAIAIVIVVILVIVSVVQLRVLRDRDSAIK
jgi:multiple sugar transport system permease protein